jgi:5-methylcytosine-specific restriction endonuclease McrA
VAERPYSTAAWQRVRAVQLRREPLCALCLLLGIARPAEHVDHIVPLANAGAVFDFENLRSLCASCHSRITAAWKSGKTEVVIGVNPETGHPIVVDRTKRA